MQRATSSSIASTKRPTSRPSYNQTTQPSTLAGLLSSKKTLVSLSTLATTKVSTSTSATSTSAYRFSFGDASDNPFLEQPPRKQFKDAAPTTSDTQQTSRQALPKSQELTRQQGLVLTRVLPINSPARIPAAAPIQFSGASSTSSTRLLPKADYEHFLSKSTAQHQDFDAAEESGKGVGSIGDTLKKSLRTTTMDIARKSIMQHAAASPRKTFLKVSEVAARSNGEPSLHDLLVASETEDGDRPMFSRMTKPAPTQSFAHPDTQFTFESTPLPPLNSKTAKRPNTQHDWEDSEFAVNTYDNYIADQQPVDADAARDKIPNHKDHAGHGHQANGSNNAQRTVDTGRETLQSSTIPALASGTATWYQIRRIISTTDDKLASEDDFGTALALRRTQHNCCGC
ncbi:hypothetical protein BGZ96_012207 [Linnemannia gamsii]|uniref:Uncharacterized protein n=1 Tax=Linnemannia gamsii TaxID=64522 RepID=A0ABQ7JR72_9FUNG|nr:hypothetical protein BGZ96_012207 [Linnemannia gamsii]